MRKFYVLLITTLLLTACGLEQQDSDSSIESSEASAATLVLNLPTEEKTVPKEDSWTLDGVEYSYNTSIQKLFDNGWELEYAIFEDFSTLAKDGCSIQVACTNPELLLTEPNSCHVTAMSADWKGDDSTIQLFTSDGFQWKEYTQYCDIDFSTFTKSTQGLYTYYVRDIVCDENNIMITYTVLNDVIMCIEFCEEK